MYDRFSFGAIFLRCKEEANEDGGGAGERADLVALVGWVPMKNWMSRRVKGMKTVSVPPAQYFPGRRRKKKKIQERSAIALPLGELPWAIESIQWRMETGRGHTLPGGGSSFV